MEGLFFSCSFAIIFWFRKKGLLPGMSQANDFIARDEGQHVFFASSVYQKLNHKCSHELAKTIIHSAADIEKHYARDFLRNSLVGLNSCDMCLHIDSIAQRICTLLGCPVEGAPQETPFDFMKMQQIPGKTNFFEKRPSEYKRLSLSSQHLCDIRTDF